MPLKSKAQERLLHAKHPKVAEEFERATSPEQRANLPEHVSKNAADETNPQRFAALWNDPSKWTELKGVPVFDSHVEKYIAKSPTGQPQEMTENFDPERLQRIAANCNRLVESGNPIGLTEGHTSDKPGSEALQPQTLGYAHNYRVAMHPSLNVPCIYHDERYYPEKYEVAKTLPYRSVERWPTNIPDGGDYFKPVALLRREPRRKLGPVAYQVGGFTVVRYSMEYAMPETPDDKATPPVAAEPPAPPVAPPAPPGGAVPPPAPGAAPGAPIEQMEPSDKDKQLFAKMCESHPVMGAMMKQYAASMAPKGNPPMPAPVEANPAAPAPAVQMAMASPSACNTTMPAPAKGPQQMSADTTEVARYAAEVTDLKDKVAELEKAERIARYGARFRHMEETEGYPIRYIEETTRCQDYTQAQFEQHVGDIEKYAANSRRPTGGPVGIDGDPDPIHGQRGTNGSAKAQPALTEAQMNRALEIEQEKHCSYKEAVRYAREEVPVRG